MRHTTYTIYIRLHDITYGNRDEDGDSSQSTD